ncbi:class I SAM-dependent methyltransferase [Streptomyces sp. NPDC046862]|uniref:SAM-dependent methyltransferase n=1 Tax=Streptomyces sp. NPDC046862 TaxID=3154603 RepID=UPI0034530532
MHTQTGAPVAPALDPVPPSRPLPSLPAPAFPARLPGLESVSPHSEDELWLHDTLLGPFSGDIVDYLRLARVTGGPVLDLGSGYGRLAVPFARHGFTVEAVDRDAHSLRRLCAWADRLGPRVRRRITTHRGELTALRLDRDYQLALLAGSMIAAVPPYARPRLLQEIVSHLGADGAVALDYTAHDAAGLAEHPCRSWAFQVPRFDGVTERVVARQEFDPAAMSERVTYCVERSGRSGIRQTVATTVKWIVDQGDLTEQLHAAGLRIADLRQQWLDRRTRSVLVVCRAVE